MRRARQGLVMALVAGAVLFLASNVEAGRGGFGGGMRGGGFGGGGMRGGGFGGGGFGGMRGGMPGGFSGGMRGGMPGGFSGGNFGGMRGGMPGGNLGGMRDFGGGNLGGMRDFGGGNLGGMREGGFDGMSGFNRTPSFGSSGRYGDFSGLRGGEGANPYAGGAGGRGLGDVQSGSRSGSYTGPNGTTIRYGGAGVAGEGPRGGDFARGVGGAQVTGPGGRSVTDVGRAGGAVGPNGAAVGSRGNLAVARGPGGTAVDASRGGFARGPNGGMIAGRENWDGRGVNGWRGNAWRNGYYAGFHNGWVHGYWAGAATGWGGWGWGYPGIGLGFGYGLGTGLAFWSMGSALYNTAGGWGYMPYYNPYYYGPVVAASAPVYDYSAPIDTMAAAPDEAVAQPAVSTFDQARAAFQAGNYDQALQLTDQALKALPADETIHEFRAQVLFALGRYDEAAATLYSVLAVGPGWDWSTLVGLYPSVDVFTQKQRALEDAVRQNPDSAAGRFVLAYLYLAQGHNDAAIQELERVTQIQPKDRVSAQILASLQKGKAATATAAADTNAAAAPAAEQPAPAATPDVRGTLGGAYTAKAEPQGSITLTIGPEDAFVWKVASGSQSHDLKGKYTYGDGVLTLVPDGGGAPLVGRLTWSDPKAFTFQAMGGGPGDPGLAFQAAP